MIYNISYIFQLCSFPFIFIIFKSMTLCLPIITGFQKSCTMENTITFGILFCTTSYLSTKLLNVSWMIKPSVSRLQRAILRGIAVATFFQFVFGSTILFVSSFKGGIAEQELLCQIDGFTTSTTTFAIINQVALMCYAFEVNICRFLERNMEKLLALCWGVPVLLSSLPFVGIGKYTSHGNNSFCCLNWESNKTSDQIYFHTMFIVAFIIPFLLILYSRVAKPSTTDNKSDYEGVRDKIMFPAALIFLTLWVPFGCVTMHNLSGFNVSGDVELLAVLCGLTSFAVLPLILCRELSNCINPSLPQYDGFDLKVFRVCLHFLLFL